MDKIKKSQIIEKVKSSIQLVADILKNTINTVKEDMIDDYEAHREYMSQYKQGLKNDTSSLKHLIKSSNTYAMLTEYLNGDDHLKVRDLQSAYGSKQHTPLNQDIQDEISNRVRTNLDHTYAEVNNIITNDTSKLKTALKQTEKNLKCIPDDVDILYKDNSLDYKQVCNCTAIEIEKQNNEYAKASHEFLDKFEETQSLNKTESNKTKDAKEKVYVNKAK